MTPRKRLFTLLLALLMTVSLLSAGITSAFALPDDPMVPLRVMVKWLRILEGTSRSKLVAEVSWDGNDAISYNEIYAFLLDKKTNGLYMIPLPNGQTFVKRTVSEPGIPETARYDVKNGRNVALYEIPLLNEGEEQITTDANGTKANGVRFGDTLVFMVTSVTDPVKWTQTDYSDPVEIKAKKPKQTDELLEPNPLKVDGRTVSLKAKKLKSKSQVVKSEKALWVRNAEGVVRYELARKYAQFTINQDTGDITVKKGTKKGTYKVKVVVTAAGNAKYLPGSKTVTVKIKVK